MRKTGNNAFDLTQGGVVERLLLVAMPIIATQFVMMSYNLVDMFLLGRVGSDAVAASGTAGMYLWLSNGLMLLGRMGAEIGVAQNLGRGDRTAARRFAQNSLYLAGACGIAYALACLLFAPLLLGVFSIREAHVAREAAVYLRIVALGMPFNFFCAVVAGSFNGSGNSRVPFAINAAGLVLNAVLDPIFIFVLGLGVAGAAIATSISMAFAAALSLLAFTKHRHRPFRRFSFRGRPDTAVLGKILRWSVPICAESTCFTVLMMLMSRITASFGAGAIAVYRVGTQIESLSWLICQGFSTALTAFVGQNYGAGLWPRIRACFRASLSIILAWGCFVTCLLFFAGEWLFALFLPDPALVPTGRTFIRILALCQIPGCVEAVGAGAFRGLGRTLPPSLASIVSNALRVLLAYALASTALGLSGVWWSISLGATLRGIWILAWFAYEMRRRRPLEAVS